MNPRYLRCVLTAIVVLPFASAVNASDIGTAFTFQGNLEDGAPPAPVTATCDFRFGLWDAVGRDYPVYHASRYECSELLRV